VPNEQFEKWVDSHLQPHEKGNHYIVASIWLRAFVKEVERHRTLPEFGGWNKTTEDSYRELVRDFGLDKVDERLGLEKERG
jgi:hypothetical protein